VTGGQISRIVEVQLVKGRHGQEWLAKCIKGFGTITRAGTESSATTFGLSGREKVKYLLKVTENFGSAVAFARLLP
jgi:hypothetical protein